MGRGQTENVLYGQPQPRAKVQAEVESALEALSPEPKFRRGMRVRAPGYRGTWRITALGSQMTTLKPEMPQLRSRRIATTRFLGEGWQEV